MELTQNQFYNIIERIPSFEASYETSSYSGFTKDYDVVMAIPLAKKNFVWFTFFKEYDVTYLIDLNKEKKMTKATRINKVKNNPLSLGTLLYGSYIVDDDTDVQYFVIEDVYLYKGIQLNNIHFIDKLLYIKEIIDITKKLEFDVVFTLPVMWKFLYSSVDDIYSVIPENIYNKIAYPVHHIQYRTLENIKPHINITLNKKFNFTDNIDTSKNSMKKILSARYDMDFSKPQYKYNTVFQMNADIQFDIYHLYAFGKNNSSVYYNISYIPDYKTSVYFNSIFRNIRENDNLDLIEESDDEDDFQDVSLDKYVDTNKIVNVECYFHFKFKKWVPIKVVDNKQKIVHISRLVRNYYPKHTNM